MPQNPASRLSYLDASRGLAALAVLLAHFHPTILPALNNSWILKTPFRIIADGEAAVLYFFILSGFVLTVSLKQVSNLTFWVYLRFIVKRIFRIFPAFLATLVLTVVLLNVIQSRPESWLDRFWIHSPDLLSAIKESLLIIRLPNDPPQRLIPQDWTLSIELAISLFLPLMAWAISKNKYFTMLVIYFAIQFLALDDFVFDFAMGVFLASNAEQLKSKWLGLKYKSPVIIASLIIICADYLIPMFMNYSDVLLIHHKSWGLAVLLWALISSQKVQRFLSNLPMVFLGRISYSFYLLHLILLLYMTDLFPNEGALIFFCKYLAITILTSTFFYYLIERPFYRWGASFFSEKIVT